MKGLTAGTVILDKHKRRFRIVEEVGTGYKAINLDLGVTATLEYNQVVSVEK